MTCDFCRSTPVAVCPMCNPATQTARPMRKAKATPANGPKWGNAVRGSAPRFAAKPPQVVTGFAPGGTLGSRSDAARIAANEARMREISAQLVQTAQEAARKAQAVRPPVLTTPPVIRAQRPAQAPYTVAMGRAVTRTDAPMAVGDWHAAARFTLGILRGKPMLVDSTCRPVESEVTQIHRGVMPGDWAGLARAVEVGQMTHAEAVEMAGNWKRSVGVAS